MRIGDTVHYKAGTVPAWRDRQGQIVGLFGSEVVVHWKSRRWDAEPGYVGPSPIVPAWTVELVPDFEDTRTGEGK